MFVDTKNFIPIDIVDIIIICNDKITIDDILFYFNYVPTLLRSFSFVAQVFTKYHLSFKLTKCNFLNYVLSLLVIELFR